MSESKSTGEITQFNPNKGDPIVQILQWMQSSFARVMPVWLSLVLLAVALGIVFFGTVAAAAFFQGVFINADPGKVTFIRDIAAPIQFGVLNPLVLVLILKHYELLSETFRRLDDIVIIGEQEKKDQIVREAQALYSKKWIIVLAAFLATIGTSVFFAIRKNTDNPYYFIGDYISVSGILTWVWGALITYVILVWVLKCGLTVRTFKSLFSYPIKYKILHLDGHAGMGKVGRYFTFLALIILIAGLTLSLFLVPLRNNWGVSKFEGLKNILYGTYYLVPFLIIGVSVYWLLIQEIHVKMVTAKEEVLSGIASRLDQSNLKAITDFHLLAKGLPEWPTPRIAVSTVVSSVIGSIIAPVLVDKAKEFIRDVFFP